MRPGACTAEQKHAAKDRHAVETGADETPEGFPVARVTVLASSVGKLSVEGNEIHVE